MTADAVDAALAAPSDEIGARLLEVPESQWFDRKSVRIDPKRLAETIVAFANADGGTIVVGLSDGMVEGVDEDPKRLNALMQTSVDFTDPTAPVQMALYECRKSDGEPDHVLVIEVPPGRHVYATNRDESFLRMGDESRKLTFTQRRELFYDKSQASYESETTRLDLEEVDRELLSEYISALTPREPARLLEARELVRDGLLTVAGALLFAHHPERAIASAQVRVSRFQGVERATGARQNLVGDERIEGPVPRMLDAVREAVRRMQPTRWALGTSGRFEDVGLVPEDAWLEGIVNALVHRSYSVQGDYIHVDIYDDRIVIESPGRFPGLVDPDNPLAIKRFARNPRIARVCTDLGITQEFGEGIRRMFDEMRSAGLGDPLYRQTAGSVRLTLSGVPMERRLTDALPAMQQQILAALRDAPSLSTGEVAEVLGAARPTVLRQLGALRDAGFVQWTGKSKNDPRASWRLSL